MNPLEKSTRAAVNVGGVTGDGYSLTLADVRPEWHDRAACQGMGPDDWYQDHQAQAAKKVCAGCTALVDCLEASLEGTNEHHGIWGGAGAAQRRLMRRLFLARTHDDPGPLGDCGCEWCVELTRHIARLEYGCSTSVNLDAPRHRTATAPTPATAFASPRPRGAGVRRAGGRRRSQRRPWPGPASIPPSGGTNDTEDGT